MAVLGTLSLGLPAARLDGGLEAVDAGGAELDLGAGELVALHQGGRVGVPDGTEHVEAKGLEGELVAEGLEGEVVARRVELLELGDVDFLAGCLLKEVDAHAVVGGALLGEGGQPGDGELVVALDPTQGQGGVRGVQGDVGGEVVAALGEGVLLRVGYVGVDDDDGDKALALVKDLDAQAGHVLADERVDDLARRDLELAEVELHVGGGLQLGEHIGDDVELLDTLVDEALVVGAPLPLGVVSIDGLVHVTWGMLILVQLHV